MPRACVVEEKIVTGRHEALQRSKNFETGLLVAQVGGKLDTLLHFAPTPEQEGGQAGVLDAEWMLEHAAQVARMLPGGLAVIGCYLFAAGSKKVTSEATLLPLLSTLAKRLDPSVAERQALLLLMPSDAKKVTCRALSAAAPTKMQPFELKMSHAPPQLCCFSADWAIDEQLTLRTAASAAAQRAQLAAQLKPASELLAAAVATVGGALTSPGQLVSSLAAGCGSVEQPHSVALFSAEATPLPPPAADDAAAAAAVRLVGVVHGRAFVSPKDDVASALAALKRDLTSSLSARLSLLFENLEEEEEEEEGGGAIDIDESGTHQLPRRAHVSVPGVPFSVCDYLAADDEPTDCAERLSALLSLSLPMDDADADALLGPEASARTLLSVAPAAPRDKGGAPASRATPPVESAKANGGKGSGGLSPAVIMLLVALLVAVVAVAFAMMGGGGGAEQAAVQARFETAPESAAEAVGEQSAGAAEEATA